MDPWAQRHGAFIGEELRSLKSVVRIIRVARRELSNAVVSSQSNPKSNLVAHQIRIAQEAVGSLRYYRV